MPKQIKYVNHMKETLIFDNKNYFIQESELYDFAWSTVSRSEKILSFTRGITPKNITVLIKGTTENELNELCDRFFEVMEKDTLAAKHGKIIIGDFYLKCYAIESKKSEYQRAQGYLKVSLQMVTDFPHWHKEITESFGAITNGILSEYGLDYPYDYAHDYSNSLVNRKLINPDLIETDFEIIIYGSCENPTISIGENTYKVNVSLETGEYLKINSEKQTIFKHKNNGQSLNVFNLRDRDNYIFTKIPAGANSIAWSGAFGFEITLLIKRSEPSWI